MTTHPLALRRLGVVLLALGLTTAAVALVGPSAEAAIVATVPMATAANYAVLGGSTVTNTGNTVLNGSLGLSPGPSITGFPPGIVNAPGVIDTNNPAAAQGQADLTAAYINAAGRPLDGTTTADLVNLTLQGGVYAGPSKGALSLSGNLTLDGAGNAATVFIFQTNSTLITASNSTITLINGAQECNIFWQVGSSATLGTGSDFAGNILALTSITVNTGVTVRGRALARNGAVTLDDDTFTSPTCSQVNPTTTTSSTISTSTTSTTSTTTVPQSTTTTSTTTVPQSTTTTTAVGQQTTTTGIGGVGVTTTAPGDTTPGASTIPGATTTPRSSTPSGGTTSSLPRSGSSSSAALALLAFVLIAIGAATIHASRVASCARDPLPRK